MDRRACSRVRRTLASTRGETRLKVSEGWEAVIRSSRLNDAGAPQAGMQPRPRGSAIGCLGYRFHIRASAASNCGAVVEEFRIMRLAKAEVLEW